MKAAILILLTASSLGAAAAERYTIDSRHSRPLFSVSHLGFSTQHGRFNSVRGTIELDRAAMSGTIDVTIDAASIDMGDEEWDAKMRGKEFFDVEEFPTIIYRSERLLFDGETPVASEGRLAVLGKLAPVRLEIEHFRCGLDVSSRRQKCGADASATLKRSIFGMDKYFPFVGDEVRLVIPVEAFLSEQRTESR